MAKRKRREARPCPAASLRLRYIIARVPSIYRNHPLDCNYPSIWSISNYCEPGLSCRLGDPSKLEVKGGTGSMMMKTGEHWHCSNPSCHCEILLQSGSALDECNTLRVCSAPMKKKYAPPSLTYLEFLRIDDPSSRVRDPARDEHARGNSCPRRRSPRQTFGHSRGVDPNLRKFGQFSSGSLADPRLLFARRCLRTSAGCTSRRNPRRGVPHHAGGMLLYFLIKPRHGQRQRSTRFRRAE
jgi:hypothetical protein